MMNALGQFRNAVQERMKGREKPRRRRAACPALTALLPLLLASCSSFDSEWRKAGAASSGAASQGIEGRWTGTWESHANNHHGKLRCIVTRDPATTGAYNFRYWANWALIVSGDFDVTYTATEKDGKVTVEGEKDLGIFGAYSHKGVITETEFSATYESEKDHGLYQMRRP